MASACNRRALQISLLLLLGVAPSAGERGHLVVESDGPPLAAEPGLDKSKDVSDIVSAATNQTLAPLKKARGDLHAKLQELDGKLAKLKEEQDALQDEAQRQDEIIRTLEEVKQRYKDMLDKATGGMKALESNYTSNTEEAGRILRCLDGSCGSWAENGTEGETAVRKEQKELEAGLLGPAPDEEHPDVSAEQKGAVRQLDAQLKADAAAESNEEGIVEKVKDFFEDNFFGDKDEKTIGEPVHEDGTAVAPGENATNATEATSKDEKTIGEPVREDGTAVAPGENATNATEATSKEDGPTSAAPVGANETEESPYDHAEDEHDLDPNCQGEFKKLPANIRQHFVGFAKGKGSCKNRAMVPESTPESEDGGPTTAEAPLETKATQEGTISDAAGESPISDADLKRAQEALKRAQEEAERAEADHKRAQEAHRRARSRMPSADADFKRDQEAITKAMEEEVASPPEAKAPEAKHHDATESTVSAGSEEGTEDEEEDDEDGNATKEVAISTGFEGDSSKSAAPRKADVSERSTVPAVTEDFSTEWEEEGNPMSTQQDPLHSSHVPGLGGLEDQDVRPNPDEQKAASGFAPPSPGDAVDECTEVKYSWKSVRPSATVCLAEGAPMTALLAAVCGEQLGPAGYDISKCWAEPYVRCQGKSEHGKWFTVDQQEAAHATVGAELQNDFANGHFTCENRVKV